MIKVYIASPYTIGDQEENVKRQLEMADELMDEGFMPFTPLLAHYQHEIYPRPYADWLKYDLVWLESCDALIRLSGESPGADIEVKKAIELGIPVYTNINDLIIDNLAI